MVAGQGTLLAHSLKLSVILNDFNRLQVIMRVPRSGTSENRAKVGQHSVHATSPSSPDVRVLNDCVAATHVFGKKHSRQDTARQASRTEIASSVET